MQTITFEQVDHLLTWCGIADTLEAGHKLGHAQLGDLLLQNKDNALLNRGAWIPGLGMAMKSMSVFPKNATQSPPLPSIQGGVLLFDDSDGSLKAVIDGILVTKWKTAGVSVLGARLLANPAPKNHLMVGAGTVATSILEAYHEVFPSIERFLVWNRTPQRAHELVSAMTTNLPCIEYFENLEEACSQADIITTATMTVEPVIKGDWITPGTHVDLIGAFKPDMREADDNLLKKAIIHVDSRDTTIGHIGEIEIPLRAGTITETDIVGDLYDLCGGYAGRKTASDITLFKNGGGAHLDLMTCDYIFRANSS